MADTPNSYGDPFWSELATGAEKKLGLPNGLLVSLLTKGEKSNADQVSEAGAKTPFQITPSTRKLVLDRDGIDAYLSPQNAAEVAGIVAKDGVNWAKKQTQDPTEIPGLAAGFYHAGGDTKNWGARTTAYVGRVTAGMPKLENIPTAPGATPVNETGLPKPAVTSTPGAGSMPDGSQSTFDRISANQPSASESAISNIYKAYTTGQMSPEQSQAFESDVKAGKLMLPQGAALKAQQGAPDAATNIVNAYNARKMSPEQAGALERDVKSGTFKVPQGLALNLPGTDAAVPGAAPGLSGPVAAAPSPGVGGALLGAGEAGLQAVTGATGGALGMLAGGTAGVVRDVNALAQGQTPEPWNVERLSQAGAQALTYAPRTASGQAQGEAVGNFMQNAAPMIGLGGEMASLGRAAAPIARATGDAAMAAPQVVRGGVSTLADRVRSAMPGNATATPTPGTMGSAGAAATDMATMRTAAAGDLPVPINLTKGQATRDFAQQQFEREAAKNPDAGAPLRARYDDQNAKMAQNIDAFIDQTGAEAPNLRATGVAVDDAVNAAAMRDKNAIRVAYKNAEKAGEMEAPVSLDTLVQHLNDSAPEATTAPILTTARNLAVKLGIAEEGADGMLISRDASLKNAEQFRQAVNRSTDASPTNIRQATIIKGLIDQGTDGIGGQLYKDARALRTRFAQNYENHGVIGDILKSKKGTTDRAVALEDIHKRTILDGSLDDVRQVRRVLQRSGEQGQQAWRELQGQTLNHIKEQALGNSARDSLGNPILSAAKLDRVIKALDADGKLDFVFGKNGAAQLRTVNDVAKDVYTSPPGSVNTSNTASVLAGLLDLGMTSVTGLPLPVASGARFMAAHMKNRKLAARVTDALNSGGKSRGMPPAPQAPMRAAPRPIAVPASTARN